MKEGIHPKYQDCSVSCACGYAFKTRSTKPVIKLEICSNCHPFFTGKQKLIDTAGRVEKFQRRFAKTEGKTVVKTKVVKTTAPKKKAAGKILTTTPKKTRPASKKDNPATGK
ncbi:MAG: 50S ribosomal protein L31 [Elusimicrobiota bacterium]|jgi:large subunit ribosomal protein L31|nr:50S ribosomal protein L31 [Elusimicrobiota bacterium]